MAVVEKEHRGIPRLTFALFAMGFYWAASRGITHVLASANPERQESFAKSGYRTVAPELDARRPRGAEARTAREASRRADDTNRPCHASGRRVVPRRILPRPDTSTTPIEFHDPD
jgi:hypothetical protein